MERHRITVSISATAGLLVGLAAFAPAGALAGGPLLSGYGGPGAGAQSIIGATLLNGSGSGSDSGGAGGGSGGPAGSPTGASSLSSGLRSGAPGAGGSGAGRTSASGNPRGGSGRESGPGGLKSSGGRAGSSSGGPAGSAPRAGGASASASQSTVAQAALASAGSSWFSAGDLLALLLVAGALALMAVATVRLARTDHE